MRVIGLSLVVLVVGCGAGSVDGGAGGSPASSGGRPGTAGDSGGVTAGAGASVTDTSGASGSTPTLPSIVAIDMLGALIGPCKSDHTEWDSTGPVPSAIIDGLATAAGQPEVGPLLDFMQQSAINALSKPDPYGIAEMDPDGSGFDPKLTITLATTADNTQDTFQPDWPPPTPGWRSVPFGPGLEVRVTLQDEDLVNPDDIGKATIKYEDLLAAWKAKDSHWVRVDGQTNKQLLAVQVQVSGIADH
jgi:hypothetical protein